MYPATIFNWHDNSAITEENQTVAIDDSPLFMQVFSADKGTEDLVEISGSDFDAMYGTMSFDRHGQSAIQAKNIIDSKLHCLLPLREASSHIVSLFTVEE